MAEEIALFIDFENIRYSLLNTQHREPDPQELINIARRYGTVMVAKAYADWSRQPEMFKGSLTAAMIDRVDCPAKQRDRYRSGSWPSPTNGNGTTPRDADMPTGMNWNSSTTSIPHITDEIPTEDITALRLDLPEPSAGVVGVNGTSAASGGPSIISGTQSTVDLNMLMDIIETVFDRPTISTFVLMTGDRDFTRICARLKLRLNKYVVVAGVPGTVSRDLTAAANQFVLLGNHSSYPTYQSTITSPFSQPPGMEPTDPQFLQFLDYIDRHWAWRTVIGVSNFIGDPYNHKNRFRGRLTRESARDLLQQCVQQGILLVQTDAAGNEDLRLNRQNSVVETALAAVQLQQQSASPSSSFGGTQQLQQSSSNGHGPYSQMGPWTNSHFPSPSAAIYGHRGASGLTEVQPETETSTEASADVLEEDEEE
jgi:NYN domain